jgi:hypothetical protein
MLKRFFDWTIEISAPKLFLLMFSPWILVAVFVTATDYGYWGEPVERGEQIVLTSEHPLFPQGTVLTVTAEPGSEALRNASGTRFRLVQTKVKTPNGETTNYRLWLDDYYQLRYEMSGITNFWAWLNHFNSYPS